MLMAITLTVNAQNVKPTKEQTVAFIKDYFKSGITTVSSEKTQNSIESHRDRFSDFEFKIDNTMLTISYNKAYRYFYSNEGINRFLNQTTYSKHQFVIDLKKIESITLSSREDPSGVAQPIAYTIYLHFKTAPGYSIDTYIVSGEKNVTLDKLELPSVPKKETEIDVIANFFQAEANFDISSSGNNKKVLQAFNHLRNLCGAPEPISFE